MNERRAIDELIAQRTLAVVGVSRSGKKFSNTVWRELRQRGYRLIPVHPHAKEIDGERCVASLGELTEPVDAALVMVPPPLAADVVRQAHAAGITRIWLQQGAESAEAVAFSQEHGMVAVAGRCILMFAEPVRSFHRLHRGLARWFGKLPV